MKALKLVMIGLLGNAVLVSFRARSQQLEVTAPLGIRAEADFYGALAGLGTWMNVGTEGRCWHPNGVSADWRPYCNGRWVWTDCGWYWQSDDPWAWACYHYGSWFDYPSIGWMWVPGTQWGPAWVTWREGNGYIGWAPMAPQGIAVATAAPQFVFVRESQFEDPIRSSSVIANDRGIFGRTKAFNAITYATKDFGAEGRHRVAVNKGPGMALVEKATGRRIKAVPIQEAARRALVPVRRTAPEKEFRNQNSPNNGAAGNTPAPAPRQEIKPVESQRLMTVPPSAQPRNAVPNEVSPPPEMRSRERPVPWPGQQPAPERGLNREEPNRQAPAEVHPGQPNEAPRNKPAANPSGMNPNAMPRQPEKAAPAQPQRQQEERER